VLGRKSQLTNCWCSRTSLDPMKTISYYYDHSMFYYSRKSRTAAENDEVEDEESDELLLRPSLLSSFGYFFIQVRALLVQDQHRQRMLQRLTMLLCMRRIEKLLLKIDQGVGERAIAFMNTRLTEQDARMCFYLYGVGGIEVRDVWRIINRFI
jgi:hypothetical protein